MGQQDSGTLVFLGVPREDLLLLPDKVVVVDIQATKDDIKYGLGSCVCHCINSMTRV